MTDSTKGKFEVDSPAVGTKEYLFSQLEVGLRFQDFVTKFYFEEHGIVINTYASREFQLRHGENVQGIEIKRQGDFRRYDTLYIETHELGPRSQEMVESGINRTDSWLWITGDETELWMIPVKHLRSPLVQEKCKFVEQPGGRGFRLPLELADRICARKDYPYREDVGPGGDA